MLICPNAEGVHNNQRKVGNPSPSAFIKYLLCINKPMKVKAVVFCETLCFASKSYDLLF